MTGEPKARTRRPAVAAVSMAAAVLLAGGGMAYWAGTAHGGEDRPAVAAERASASGPAGSPSPTAPPGIAPGEPDPGGGVRYRAAAELPEGPGVAAPYRLSGKVTERDAARLAAALGLAGRPVLSGGLWRAGAEKDGSGPRFQVAESGPGAWSFTRYRPGSDDCVRGRDTCGPATLPEGPGRDAGVPAGSDFGEPVTEEAAKAAAAPVLEAAGLKGARLDARLVLGGVRVVSADPVIGGLPTQGWATKVHVGADGQVVGGSGELSAPVRGEDRRVLTAGAALDRLNTAGPRASIGGCATPVPLEHGVPDRAGEAEPAQDPCPVSGAPDPRPVETVTGAELGLTPRTEGGERQLVPAWLFTVAGRDGAAGRVVAQPAAADEPAGAPKAGTVPGFAYEESDRRLTVHFWGGVCSDYALEVREHPGSVMVRITDTPRDPGAACVLIAQEMSVSARLAEPLGTRKVVDAGTGEALRRQG
ncbi:hypothetical protein [Streptomyces sp. NPDC097619]|uniref:hypothetical protein n=1 Tax=Streptomyces sp. NPDC097619 TaxID=3157228 RepID=UPI0033266AB6